jgi:hypothetical protein
MLGPTTNGNNVGTYSKEREEKDFGLMNREAYILVDS